MTEQSPITPPPELVQQWINEEPGVFAEHVAARAAQWGADAQLEACESWVGLSMPDRFVKSLRAAMRPKPPSQKEMALEALDRLVRFNGDHKAESVVRQVLEALPDD